MGGLILCFMQKKLLTFLLHIKKLITDSLQPSGCNWLIFGIFCCLPWLLIKNKMAYFSLTRNKLRPVMAGEVPSESSSPWEGLNIIFC